MTTRVSRIYLLVIACGALYIASGWSSPRGCRICLRAVMEATNTQRAIVQNCTIALPYGTTLSNQLPLRSCHLMHSASVAVERAVATVDHSDIRGSTPHNRDPSGAASNCARGSSAESPQKCLECLECLECDQTGGTQRGQGRKNQRRS